MLAFVNVDTENAKQLAEATEVAEKIDNAAFYVALGLYGVSFIALIVMWIR